MAATADSPRAISEIAPADARSIGAVMAPLRQTLRRPLSSWKSSTMAAITRRR